MQNFPWRRLIGVLALALAMMPIAVRAGSNIIANGTASAISCSDPQNQTEQDSRLEHHAKKRAWREARRFCGGNEVRPEGEWTMHRQEQCHTIDCLTKEKIVDASRMFRCE